MPRGANRCKCRTEAKRNQVLQIVVSGPTASIAIDPTASSGYSENWPDFACFRGQRSSIWRGCRTCESSALPVAPRPASEAGSNAAGQSRNGTLEPGTVPGATQPLCINEKRPRVATGPFCLATPIATRGAAPDFRISCRRCRPGRKRRRPESPEHKPGPGSSSRPSGRPGRRFPSGPGPGRRRCRFPSSLPERCRRR